MPIKSVLKKTAPGPARGLESELDEYLTHLDEPSKKRLERQEALLINEISLVLSEKRTSLAVMRTGLAVLVLPLSVLSVLIVISRYYEPEKVIYLLAPLLSFCTLLTALGFHLIYKAIKRIRALDKLIVNLKHRNPNLKILNDIIEGDLSAGLDCVDEKS